jgi:hypothetical protein
VTPLPASSKRLGSYGIDAPYLLFVPAGFLLWNLIDGLMHPRVLVRVAVIQDRVVRTVSDTP